MVARRLGRTLNKAINASLASGRGGAASGGGPSFAMPLDTISSAVLAFSVNRKLKTIYAGPLIRVRRSSDSTEQDISASSSGILDTAALLTFCGVGNGFVTKVYDQSGHAAAKDLEQATATAQPQIVASGVVVTRGSIPYFASQNDDWLGLTSWNTRPSDAYQCIVAQQAIGTFVTEGSNSGAVYGLIGQNGSGATQLAQGNPDLYVNGSLVALHASLTRDTVHDAVATDTPCIVRSHSANFNNASYASYRTSYSVPTDFPAFDAESERIVITDASEVAALESNMADFYGITLP